MLRNLLALILIFLSVFVCASECEYAVAGGRFYEYSIKAALSKPDVTNGQAIGVCYVQFFDEVHAPLKRYENVYLEDTSISLRDGYGK